MKTQSSALTPIFSHFSPRQKEKAYLPFVRDAAKFKIIDIVGLKVIIQHLWQAGIFNFFCDTQMYIYLFF